MNQNLKSLFLIGPMLRLPNEWSTRESPKFGIVFALNTASSCMIGGADLRSAKRRGCNIFLLSSSALNGLYSFYSTASAGLLLT